MPITHAASDCASVDEPSERLACYDREFPRNPPSTKDSATKDSAAKETDATSESVTAETQSIQRAPQETVDTDGNKRVVRESSGGVDTGGHTNTEGNLQPSATTSTSDKPANTNPNNTADESVGKKRGFAALFSRREPVLAESTIVALRRRESQNLIFLLANDQIWLQDAPRATDPFRQGDRITIRSGKIGGYFMTSENGTSTRVRRIK